MVLWHIYLTRYCNLHCTYCGADPKFETIPHEPQYDIKKLLSFLKQDSEPIINFYGGEPLLRIKNMVEIIDSCLSEVSNIKFVLQTNGLLLHKIPEKYVNKFHSILVSIDGRPSITNNYRGTNIYQKLQENLDYITKTCNFKGELIARMTVSRNSDIYEEVTYLLDPKNDLGFTHVHWQLDALWNSESWPDFSTWLQGKYNSGIQRLIVWWKNELVSNNKIYGIVPFLGILTTLLTNSKTDIRCGAGISSYTISTDGSIVFCPIGPEEPEAIVGSLDSEVKDLKKIYVSEPCTSCEVLDICGGRCLYTNFFKPGTESDYIEVCNATKYLINEIRVITPQIQEYIKAGKYKENDFIYPEINNGTEIIP